MSDYSTLQIVMNDGVAEVTINNPPLNILDARLMTDLDAFTSAIAFSNDVRVIVFSSADEEFFIAHGDMGFVDDPKAFAELTIAPEQDSRLNPMQRIAERMRRLPQVTIGKLAGFARGGGAELLAAMDMRFASIERGRLGQTEVAMGIMPGGGGTAYLPRLLGRARALEVVLGGALFDAVTAERYGWINRALPDDELDVFVTTLARRISRASVGQIAALKTAIDATQSDLLPALVVENEQLATVFTGHAAMLTRQALSAGAQTREGERRLEQLLDELPSSRAT